MPLTRDDRLPGEGLMQFRRRKARADAVEAIEAAESLSELKALLAGWIASGALRLSDPDPIDQSRG